MSARTFETVCIAPCRAELPEGRIQLGVGPSDRNLIKAKQVVDITGDGVVYGSYVDRTGLRIAGVVIGAAGLLAASVLATAGLAASVSDSTTTELGDVDGGLMAAAGVTTGLSIIIGGAMILTNDHAEISYQPSPGRYR